MTVNSFITKESHKTSQVTMERKVLTISENLCVKNFGFLDIERLLPIVS